MSETRIRTHIIMPSRVCYCQDGDRKSGSVSVRGGWEMRMLWMESSCTLTHTPLRWQMSDFQRAVKLSLSPLYALVHFALSRRLSNRALLPRPPTHTELWWCCIICFCSFKGSIDGSLRILGNNLLPVSNHSVGLKYDVLHRSLSGFYKCQ